MAAMRKIDAHDMVIVHYGKEWTFRYPPCNKKMMVNLERNEALVYWLQPREGDYEKQVPAIKMQDGFYSLSLRMMKAIWRHVRLKKGFRNVERAQLGGMKLRIPTMLLTEKMRTQMLFNEMRMQAQTVRNQSKAPLSAAAKVSRMVTELFLPMSESFIPAYTPFSNSPVAEEIRVLETLADLFPEAMVCRGDFVACMGGLYDRNVCSKTADDRVLSEATAVDRSLSEPTAADCGLLRPPGRNPSGAGDPAGLLCPAVGCVG